MMRSRALGFALTVEYNLVFEFPAGKQPLDTTCNAL
jgi:hypothetical protein